MNRRTMKRNGQSGVMLIEALIGILIFSIGILALLGMQATAMRATIDAKYRSEAAFLANEIIGVMWVNRANLSQFATASCSSNTECNAWNARVQAILPSGAATIVISTQQATVTVSWQRPGESTVSNHVAVAQINNS
jgi:type IV pilus assembly protein PilV